MPFNNYAESALLCNVSVKGAIDGGSMNAFRGDMIIEEGSIADAQGRRNPPKSVLSQAVCLSKDGKIIMLAGAINKLEFLPELMERYQSDFAADIDVLLYVDNLEKPFTVELNGLLCKLIPRDEGAIWSLLMDDLRMEKSDFKGQSAETKVLTMFEALKDFKPKYETTSFDDALGYTREVVKEARGPV